ncbi:hypothetical protein ACROYT_G004490 [Oculina patagonica]
MVTIFYRRFMNGYLFCQKCISLRIFISVFHSQAYEGVELYKLCERIASLSSVNQVDRRINGSIISRKSKLCVQLRNAA